MTKITKITTQKKNKSRYNIFINKGQGETYGFSVDEDILIKYMLRKGMELEENLIEQLIKQDDVHKAYSLAINFLSYRMRSEKEIFEYLKKKEIDDEQIKLAIKKLYTEGYLDDREFALSLVRTRISTSSKGPLLIKKELMEKGVSPTIIEDALQVFTWDKQYQKAAKWLDKKLRLDGKKSFQQQLQTVQQTLMTKGFTQDVIKEVVTEAGKEKDEDAEYAAVVHQGEKLLRKYERKTEGFELKQKVKAALYRKGFSFDYIEQFLNEAMEEE